MIKDVIELLQKNLNPYFGLNLPISHLAGLTFLKEFTVSETDNVKNSYPVPVDSRESKGNVLYLVPDKSKRCVVWFESTDFTQKDINSGYMAKGRIDLFCWYNSEHFSCGFIQSKLVRLLMSALKGDFEKNEIIKSLSMVPVSIEENKPTIFSKYSYNKTNPEALLPPFSYFKISYDATFAYSISDSCTTDLVVIDPKAC